MMTVIPAYGRDYKNAADAMAAWNAGKDFMVADMSSPWDGSYVNKGDYSGRVKIRYLNKRRLCVAGGDA
jgi:hypothetical protein